ncbi:MAG: MFS transporter [Actinomycetota bacterium]
MEERGLGPNYLKMWTASAISYFGDGIRLTALPLLAASITRDPKLVAGISVASWLPWLLFSLVSGAVADRVDRRLLMGRVQLFRFVIAGALGIIAIVGWSSLPLIYALAFLLGTAETLFDNAAQAIMPALVPRSRLEEANGRLYAAELTANEFAGPPAGGFLFTVGAGLPFVIDAATFGVSGALVLALRGRFVVGRENAEAPSKIGHDIGEGLKWLWRHRLLRTLAAMVGVMNMFHTAALAIFVLFAIQILALGPTGYGILLTAFAVGSVPGSLLGARISKKIGPGPTLLLCVLLGGVSYLGAGLTSSAIVVGLSFVIGGFVAMAWNVVTVSLRQAIIPDRLLARVNSVYRLLAWGTMPVGAALGGVLADLFGLRAPFLVGAAVVGAMAFVTLPIVNNTTLAAARAEADSWS